MMTKKSDGLSAGPGNNLLQERKNLEEAVQRLMVAVKLVPRMRLRLLRLDRLGGFL